MTTQPEIKLPPLPTNVPHVTRRIQRTQVISAAEVVLEHFASEYARAAILADRAARAGAWQPIATAPKDGTEIWAFNGEQARMKWSEGPEWALWIWSDETLNDVDPSPDSPTHWMPLPAAPTQERGADDE